MQNQEIKSVATSSIGAVERDTGLSKDTLRVWERRYGFPLPVRDAFGERVYLPDQVEKLRLIKHLMDQGHRPGKIVAYDVERLQALLGQGSETGPAREMVEERADLLHYIALCKAYQFEQLRRELSQALVKLGLYRFVIDITAPLTTMVGVRWANGSFAIYEEHLYTESMHVVLRNAISSIPLQIEQGSAMQPRVLLTTFPQEQHSLGLLMAEALFSLEGARCISLGVQTPILDIARAAETQRADIVALSFSAAMNAKQLASGVQDLRGNLPPAVEIWAGGTCSGLYRRPPAELRVLGLEDIGSALTEWRIRHPAAMSGGQ